MSDLSVFNNKVEENGIVYYIFPSNYPLFKANKILNEGAIITLKPNIPYFFGLKNMNKEYIDSYENEYGVIFEFITTRQYKLIALDDKKSQEMLYKNAPSNIKLILEKNYGYKTGNRDSVSESDRIFSNYLCSIGFEGYAIHNMETDMGGIFHDELMICNTDGIEYVKQVTPDYRVKNIIESGKLKSLSKSMKASRKANRPSGKFIDDDEFVSRGRLMFGDDNDFKPKRNLFDDDITGGKKYKRIKKKYYKNTKKNKNKKNKTRRIRK